MFAAFVLFLAFYIMASILIRLLQTKFTGTSFGAALAYIQ